MVLSKHMSNLKCFIVDVDVAEIMTNQHFGLVPGIINKVNNMSIQDQHRAKTDLT